MTKRKHHSKYSKSIHSLQPPSPEFDHIEENVFDHVRTLDFEQTKENTSIKANPRRSHQSKSIVEGKFLTKKITPIINFSIYFSFQPQLIMSQVVI